MGIKIAVQGQVNPMLDFTISGTNVDKVVKATGKLLDGLAPKIEIKDTKK